MTDETLHGQDYRVAFSVYSADGLRAAHIIEFRSSGIYLDEQECLSGGPFENRHSGRLVGPFDSPEAAEAFIVATAWFKAS